MVSLPQSDSIADLLKRAKTIAVVGLSNSPLRPSHGVSAYMQTHGYRIIPVNPEIKGSLGEKAYSSLIDVPEKIDIVNIFRRPEFVEEVVDQAIQLKVPAIWMQEGVIHERAAAKSPQSWDISDHGSVHSERAPRAFSLNQRANFNITL